MDLGAQRLSSPFELSTSSGSVTRAGETHLSEPEANGQMLLKHVRFTPLIRFADLLCSWISNEPLYFAEKAEEHAKEQ